MGFFSFCRQLIPDFSVAVWVHAKISITSKWKQLKTGAISLTGRLITGLCCGKSQCQLTAGMKKIEFRVFNYSNKLADWEEKWVLSNFSVEAIILFFLLIGLGSHAGFCDVNCSFEVDGMVVRETDKQADLLCKRLPLQPAIWAFLFFHICEQKHWAVKWRWNNIILAAENARQSSWNCFHWLKAAAILPRGKGSRKEQGKKILRVNNLSILLKAS